MIDLLIIIVIAWCTVIGWTRGGFRSLLDCTSAGCAIAVIIFSVPLLKDGFVDSFWALQLRRWINQHLTAVPAGFGLESVGSGVADKLYHYLVVGAGAAAVFVGIQIILQVYLTVWTQPPVSVLSRSAGAAVGSLMGGTIAIYMVQCLGLLTWITGLETLDYHLAESFIRWVTVNYILT